MLVICWWLLTRVLFRVGRKELPEARIAVRRALEDMGAMSVAEKRVAIEFAITET
jgi:di/tricarboxylate transporter